MKIKRKKNITVCRLQANSLEELRRSIQELLNGVAKKRRFKGISNIIQSGSIYQVLLFYKYYKYYIRTD